LSQESFVTYVGATTKIHMYMTGEADIGIIDGDIQEIPMTGCQSRAIRELSKRGLRLPAERNPEQKGEIVCVHCVEIQHNDRQTHRQIDGMCFCLGLGLAAASDQRVRAYCAIQSHITILDIKQNMTI
jgi:hypothetical protein